MTQAHASAVILAALEGARVTPEERKAFTDVPPAGFTLFRRNLSSRYSEVRDLCHELQAFDENANRPMLLAIDQEGGRVARLRAPFPNFGPAMDLLAGRTDPDALSEIENMAFIMGACLRELGITVDFAPVLDVLTRDDNPAIGDRCFGRSPEAVSLRASAFLSGLHAARVLGCLKHFPGQGDANADTHESGTVIHASLETLHARELHPFKELAMAAPMIMVSHAVYPALDPDRPASLSPLVMQNLLREEMGYRGLIVSDDMNMKAIDQSRGPWSEAVVASVAAGADLVLVCRELDRYYWAVEAIGREAQKSPAFAARLNDASARVQSIRSQIR